MTYFEADIEVYKNPKCEKCGNETKELFIEGAGKKETLVCRKCRSSKYSTYDGPSENTKKRVFTTKGAVF